MAKKQETKVSPQADPGDEHVETVVEAVAINTPPVTKKEKTRERIKPKNEWEIKDRLYLLKNSQKPLSRSIKSANIYYFDEELGYERELKYCQNQKTCFSL